MEKQIAFNEGLVCTPYSDVSADGQLSTMHGVEVHAGSVRPSLLLGSDFKLNGELMFIHKTGYYTHYLYLVDDSLFYRDANDVSDAVYNDVPTDGQEGYNLVAAAADIVGLKEIAATGNVLTFLCEGKDLLYGMWQEDKYEFLGAMPELEVTFALEGEEKVHKKAFDMNIYQGGPNNNDILTNDYREVEAHIESLNNNEQNYIYVSTAVKEFEEVYCNSEGGGFVHPFYVRAAWKMYDGTYTRFTSPILMIPNTRWPCVILPQAYGNYDSDNELYRKHLLTMGDEMPANKADWNIGAGAWSGYTKFTHLNPHGYVIANVMKLVCKINSPIPEGWKSLIVGMEVMVSQPLVPCKLNYQAADQEAGVQETLVHEALSISYGKKNNRHVPARFVLEALGGAYRKIIGIEFDEVSAAGEGYTMRFDEKKRFKYWTANLESSNGSMSGDYIADIYSDEIKAVVLERYTEKELVDMYKMDDGFGLFHLKTIIFDELSTNFKAIELKAKQYNSITTQNRTYIDTWSRVKFFPKDMIEYNGRINLYNNKVKYWVPTDASLIQPHTNTTARGYTEYFMDVYVKIHRIGQEKLIKIGNSEVSSYYFDPLYYLFIPNTGVRSVIFVDKSWYEIVDGQRKHKYDEIDMTSSISMDGVYFFSLDGYRPDYDDAQSVGRRFEDDYGDLIVEADIDNQPNKIYTSDTDNPFIYTAKGQNQVGGGRILKMATMTKPLSEGQMGTFPLVAFCTDGNYALSIIKSGENAGLYEQATPMRPDVCINAASVLGIEEGIFFVSQRGLMLLTENDAVLLSEKIDGVKDVFGNANDNANDNENDNENDYEYGEIGSDERLQFNEMRPREYIEGCIPAWDYTNSRLLLLRPGYKEAYVFKADDKTWSTIELEDEIKTVLSSYPFSYVQFKDKTVKVLDDDYNYSEENPAEDGMIVTRPLKLDTLLQKRINEFALHGNFSEDQEITLYGSNDLRTWNRVGSTSRRHVRNMRGYYYKYWRFKIETHLKENENISGVEVKYSVKQDGRFS